jgi:NADH-quinone oxidoreductase subunit L
MEHDPGAWRFFTYLNLFMGMMLCLILGNNLLVMFLGWEGVGLCSYLLIGFWYEKQSATDAGKKAFIVNRIGDFAFILGVFLVFVHFKTLDLREVATRAPHVLAAGGAAATAIGLLLFAGATGKSAQIPLYTWLPDAMEGPTPVSALIHAATMVTAGVYMVARMSPVYALAPDALMVVAVVGCLTAAFAATIGTAQDDIKRVLAYSTISQLGYMFLACGVGAFSVAIFHVMTHAFFKALLFLGAGAVIHALHDEQNIWKMGALRDKIKSTYLTFFVGCLAIAGIPPFAGFFSKDAILEKTFASGNLVLYVVALLTAALTAFYMFRLLFVTFWGTSRVDSHTLSHLHPPSKWMTIPLGVLAVLSVFGGLVGVPGSLNRVVPFLEESVAQVSVDHGLGEAGIARAGEGTVTHPATAADEATTHSVAGHAEHHLSKGTEIALMVLSVIAALAGIALAREMYLRRPGAAKRFRDSPLGRLVHRKYLVDEMYDRMWVRPTHRLADFLWQGVDVVVIDGLVNGSGRIVGSLSGFVRRSQTGQTQAYLFSILLGLATVLVFFVSR